MNGDEDDDEIDETDEQEGDRLLMQIVDAINVVDAQNAGSGTAEPSISLTVLVGGAVITGLLIGAVTFQRAYGERLRRAFANDADLSRQIETDYREATTALSEEILDAEASGRDLRSRYVNLREARIVDASGRQLPSDDPLIEGLLIRIPLDRVDTFFWGTLTTSRNSS